MLTDVEHFEHSIQFFRNIILINLHFRYSRSNSPLFLVIMNFYTEMIIVFLVHRIFSSFYTSSQPFMSSSTR